MGIFDSIRNIFYEEEHPIAGQSPVAGTKAMPQPKPLQPHTPAGSAQLAVNTSSTDLDDKVYKEFGESLKRALENNNLPGFDFFEFRQLFLKFKSSGKSEAEAMETALASAETMRVDKNMIIANYQHYEKVLRDQRVVFDQEFAAFHRDNISKPAEQQRQIDREILEKENAIRQFAADIEALKAKKIQLAANAVKAEQQTRQVEASFHKAFQDISTDLQDLVQRLKSK